jgi:hypothetical protein
MQLPSVDRNANWRSGAMDARPVASNRLQSVRPVATEIPEPASTSVREVPALPVKQLEDARNRGASLTDRAAATVSAAAATSVNKVAVPSTMDVARSLQSVTPSASNATPEASSARSSEGIDAYQRVGQEGGNQGAANRTGQPDSLQASDSVPKSDDQNKASGAAALSSANAAAAEKAAAQKEKPPEPKEPPLSKLLTEFVQSLWSASRAAVDAVTPTPEERMLAAMNPEPKNSAAGDGASSSSTSAQKNDPELSNKVTQASGSSAA